MIQTLFFTFLILSIVLLIISIMSNNFLLGLFSGIILLIASFTLYIDGVDIPNGFNETIEYHWINQTGYGMMETPGENNTFYINHTTTTRTNNYTTYGGGSNYTYALILLLLSLYIIIKSVVFRKNFRESFF